MSSRRRDPAHLYARNGRGYIRRPMRCGVCLRTPCDSAGARGRSTFHPIGPVVLSVEMRASKESERSRLRNHSLTLENNDDTVVNDLATRSVGPKESSSFPNETGYVVPVTELPGYLTWLES